MRFADPYLLLLLIAIPALLWLKVRLTRERAGASFSNLELLAGYRPTWRVRYRWVPTLFRAGAVAMLVVALARPQQGQAESELPGQGIDIALVLDTSGSMTSTPLGRETRLAVAQNNIREFISGRREDRIGLVIFADRSLVLSPLTLDYEALKSLVTDVTQVDVGGNTAIGMGLAEAVELLRGSRARSRVVILLTDGENNSGDIDPGQAARIAQALGVRVHTIGILDSGTRAANVNEEVLTQMAEVTGGRYFPVTSPESLARVYENIDQLEKSRIGRLQFAAYDELAWYFLAAAIGLLAVELLANMTIWRRAL
ncbi:MAG TPA: VWA domain-containing protein [Dehalococcoidia bacterium]|nr:VWA domain-containing protein [Dehalococcoidia bacterium]